MMTEIAVNPIIVFNDRVRASIFFLSDLWLLLGVD